MGWALPYGSGLSLPQVSGTHGPLSCPGAVSLHVGERLGPFSSWSCEAGGRGSEVGWGELGGCLGVGGMLTGWGAAGQCALVTLGLMEPTHPAMDLQIMAHQ